MLTNEFYGELLWGANDFALNEGSLHHSHYRSSKLPITLKDETYLSILNRPTITITIDTYLGNPFDSKQEI